MNKLQKIGASLLGLKSMYSPGFQMIVNAPFLWGSKSKTEQLTIGYENKIVYAVVNLLVRKLVEAPQIVYKVTDKKALRKLDRYKFKDFNVNGTANVLLAKALDELEDHVLMEKLESPNDYQTGIELKENFWFNYQLTGDGYIWVETLEDGQRANQPVKFHSLNADRVIPYRTGAVDHNTPIEYYTYTAWNGAQIRIYPKEIMHMTKWSPLDPILGGFSPQRAGSREISKDNANDVAQGAQFINGGTGTIIGSDSMVVDGVQYYKMSKEQKESIEETVKRDWRGAANNGSIHVTNGLVNVQKYGDTLVDMNAIEAGKASKENICALWGVNSILIGDKSGGSENNVKIAEKQVVTNVVVPELRKFDAKFMKFMRDGKWYPEKLDVRHDLTEFSELLPDYKLMTEIYGKPNLTEDERRKLYNFDKFDNPKMGATVLVPTGVQPLDLLLDGSIEDDLLLEDGKSRGY